MENQDNDTPNGPLEVPETIQQSGFPGVSSPELVMLEGLTPRQREVFQWICEGKRDREIALILGISYRTVSVHVRAILNKLGVENRTCAAMMGARMIKRNSDGDDLIKNTYFYVCLAVSEMLVRSSLCQIVV